MEKDFQEAMILLMRNPIMHTPIEQLTVPEAGDAYDLAAILADQSAENKFSKLDYMQHARLEFLLAELGIFLGEDWQTIVPHYHNAFVYLERGGFNLGVEKWVELASARKIEFDDITKRW